ncbi:OsmC family protein [Pleionea sp. CnH1-48]|uniref:OsmC family protein n=1 Tax=Pleionea sp. CnH1-48 TaxID=2954494 RepID=UPI00209857F0|nr:OsmC family protein [Pleionea sp. CnH1-48]
MQAKVIWERDLNFLAECESGQTTRLSGNGEHLSPMEAVLSAVGGCSSIDVVMILQKSRQEITGCECNLEAKRAENDPKVFTNIHAHYVISGKDISEHHVKRACGLSLEKYCSVALMLTGNVDITHSYEIV